MAAVRIGIDIGGTFTDLVLLRGGSVAAVGKTLTTPSDPSVAVSTGVQRLLEHARPEEIVEVVHGTTLVANSLIERKGADTALLTTRGFRDALAIRREHRYDLYDLFIELPEPLVPRRRRWELDERVLADGTVDIPLDAALVRQLARRARRSHVEALAVCLLHSYRNPVHEQQAASLLREELPGIPVSISSEVAPELGEYVRSSTTVANAFVQPLVERYLTLLERRLAELGVVAPVHVMLSTGGLTDVETARRYPIRMAESGPSAGAISAAFFGGTAGLNEVLAFDMGGTTAKACLVEGGAPLIAREHEVARAYRFAKESGLPVRLPVVDLIEIGAGGGSIARANQFGLPAVGPDSSGSEPGPACYARGGTEPTVTDADLLLGYVDPNFFLGGEMRLDVEAAGHAVGRFASAIGLGVQEAAAAIHRVVNENMAAAARMHAIERGRDLRRFALVATGGAGPVHAWGVARALGIRKIVYPPSAGVASAFGMLTARPAFDFTRSLPAPLAEVCWNEVRGLLEEMRREGVGHLLRTGVVDADVSLEIAADARHLGQGESLTVPLGPELSSNPALQVEEAFERAYVQLYGRRPPGVRTEVLTWRLRVMGLQPRVSAAGNGSAAGNSSSASAAKGTRPIWSEERAGFVEAQVVDRYRLKPGDVVVGPAAVEERESTAIIVHGGTAAVDQSGNLLVTIGG
jgi:N-methylhydantoinase A